MTLRLKHGSAQVLNQTLSEFDMCKCQLTLMCAWKCVQIKLINLGQSAVEYQNSYRNMNIML
jgi:hypothetical protein